MNYSKAFSYVFDDKDWVSKILIAGLIFLIPIVGQIYMMGWSIEIIRRYKAGRRDILPATHFSAFLTLGLKMLVVGLIYAIPVIILTFILNLFTGISSSSDSGTIQFIFGSLGCFGGLLSILVNLLIALVGVYGMIKLAETDQIKACLDFSDIYNCIKANLGKFVIVALLMIVAELIQGAGLIICIGIIFTAPYGYAISAHLVGQLWDNLDTSYDRKAKPFRGSTRSSDDIIEEAPFTKVEDIEKKAAEETADVPEEIVIEEPAVEEPAAEEPAAEEPVAEEPAAEVSEPDPLETPAAQEETPADEPAEEKPADDSDNDLPSFE